MNPVCSSLCVKRFMLQNIDLFNFCFSTEESAQKDQLESFLTNSMTFYQSLIGSIEEKYGFQLTEVLAGRTVFQSKTHFRSVSGDGVCVHV